MKAETYTEPRSVWKNAKSLLQFALPLFLLLLTQLAHAQYRLALSSEGFSCGPNGQVIIDLRIRVMHTGTTPAPFIPQSLTLPLNTQMGTGFGGIVPGTLRFFFEQSSAATAPSLNPAYTGVGSSSIINPGGQLMPGQMLVYGMQVYAAPGRTYQVQATSTAFDGTSTAVVTDLSDSGRNPATTNPGAPGDTGGHDDPTVIRIPGLVAPPVPLEVDVCDTWQVNIAEWLKENGQSAVFHNGNTLDCIINDYFIPGQGWVSTGCGANAIRGVSFTAKYVDTWGNMSSLCFNSTIRRVDKTPPFFDMLPMNKTIDCASSSTSAASQVQMWLANNGGALIHACAGNATVTNNYNGVLPTCNTPRTVVFTATDHCGRSTTASATLTIVDNTPPVISNVPANITLTCPATATFSTPTATDNCGPATLTFTDATTGTPCPGSSTTTRTWIATDRCGNTVTATSRVTIVPSTPTSVVTINCPANINVTATTGATSAVVTFAGPTASTTCTSGSNVTITQISGPSSGSNFPVGTTQVCFRATDACGSSTSCCFTVTVVGSTVNPPGGSTASINCPSNITMTAPAGTGGMVVNFPTPTANTTCTQTGTLNVVQISGLPSGSFFPVGTSTVCFRVTDACGGSSSCCFTVTVNGNTPPGSNLTLTVPPNVTINCGQPAVLPPGNVSTTCPAGGANVTWVDAVVGTSCSGITYRRTYTATDACGNQATAVHTITQLPDTTPPTWTSLPPQDQMINCGTPINYGTATASDCSTPVNVTFTVTNNGATSCNTVNGITYGYDLYVHWVATDLCGNVTTTTTNIWVLPSTNIAFLSKPDDKQVACSESMTWEQPMPKSFIADIVHVDYVDDYNLDACGSGTVTRTWTATDAEGNTCQAQQIHTILPDLEKPTISLPYSHTTVDCKGNMPNLQPIVSDNCTYVDDLVVTTIDQQWGQTIERTYVVTDACGNVNAAILTITLADYQAPVFQPLPAPKTIACGTPVVFEQAVATDGCQLNSLTYVDQVQTTACSETHTRTWTAVDANGNTSQAQQIITVTDQSAPVFAVDPQDKTVACAGDILFAQPTATDACGSVIVYFNDVQTTPTCGNSGYTVTRTWTANDGCNNLAQVNQTITVEEDHTAPVIYTSFPNVTEVTMAQSQNWQVPALNVSDDCNSISVTHQVSVIDNCNFSVTYAATDACGNFSTVIQLVRIIDGPCTVLGTDDFVGNIALNVYPNPTAGQLTVSMTGELATEYECVIFDVFGRQVFRQTITQAKSVLELDTLASGSYWLSLTDGQNHGVVKFVKAGK